MSDRDLHRYGGSDLAREEHRWRTLAIDRVRWHAAPGTTGEICKSEHQLFVTIAGSVGRTRARTADGTHYDGTDFPGAVTFVPAGCHRQAIYGGGALEYIGIRIGPEHPMLAGIGTRLQRPFTNRADPLLHRLALALDVAPRHPAPALYAETAASLLILHLAEATPAPRPDMTKSLGQSSLRRTLDYIEAHLDDRLPLTTLATVAGIEDHRFAREFTSTMGVTAPRYVAQRRMERAAELLRPPSEASIADIAAEVGMSSQSHLTTAFRRTYGTTPAAYRSHHR